MSRGVFASTDDANSDVESKMSTPVALHLGTTSSMVIVNQPHYCAATNHVVALRPPTALIVTSRNPLPLPRPPSSMYDLLNPLTQCIPWHLHFVCRNPHTSIGGVMLTVGWLNCQAFVTTGLFVTSLLAILFFTNPECCPCRNCCSIYRRIFNTVS